MIVKPTDEEILAAVTDRGHIQTYQVANRLNRKFPWVDTPWVYRRLIRLERNNQVKRDYGSLWGNTVFWQRVVE